jgi:hypothetical protein
MVPGCATLTPPSQWGAHYSTPGSKLEFIEAGRKTQADGTTIVEYRLKATNLPRDNEYVYWGRRAMSPPREIRRFVFGPNGGLVSKSDGEPIEDVNIVVMYYQKGLAIEAALVSVNGEVRVFAKVIPFPIEARDGACRIWLELISADGMAFIAQGEGFPAGEDINVISRSDGEQMSHRVKVYPDGTLPPSVLFPATVGQGYKASLGATATTCSPMVDYERGPPAVKPR